MSDTAIGKFKRTCTECGVAFRSDWRQAEFCCVAHRKAFNNRRSVRGAELYDLVMVMRYDRGLARIAKVWKLICRLAAEYRAEDMREREGRESWNAPSAIVERKPYLHGITMSIAIKRKAA